MANGRFISRSIAYDTALARLSLPAETMYLKSIPHLDRDGCITGQPLALLGIISPMRFSELQGHIAAIIDEWIAVGLVVRYGPAHTPTLFFPGFLKHQRLRYERESPSVHPCPPGFLRTDKGLVPATQAKWLAPEQDEPDSRVLPQTPAESPQTPAKPPQEQEQEQGQEQEQEQQQQQGPAAQPRPAAAATVPLPAARAPQENPDTTAEHEKHILLAELGISPPALTDLVSDTRLTIPYLRAWIAATETYAGRNRAGFLIARWRAHDPPPAGHRPAHLLSYDDLVRRYIPPGYEHLIEH